MDENLIGNILSGMIAKQDGDTFTGSNFVWVIVLLFFFWMFGGMGFNRGNQAATQQDVAQAFDFNQLDNGVRAIQNGLCSLGYENQAQTASIISAIGNVGTGMQECCCGINRNIDAVRYDMANATSGINRNIDAVRYEAAQNTCAITTNATANTQKVLDAICQMRNEQKEAEIAQLRTDLQAAQLTLGNAAQTSAIIGALRPAPIPAYITASPYAGVCGYTGTTIV